MTVDDLSRAAAALRRLFADVAGHPFVWYGSAQAACLFACYRLRGAGGPAPGEAVAQALRGHVID